MVSRAFKNVSKQPTTITSIQRSTERPCRKVAWTISGRTYLQKEYQKEIQTLSQTIGEHFQSSITSQFRRSGVAGVLNRKYLPIYLI